MLSSSKTIITCALTGSAHTPTMSDALPLTPEQITADGLASANAGAAILHLHARDPRTGQPTPDPDVFKQFLTPLHEGCDAALNISTGGSSRMTVEDRLAAALRFQPELASLNMGSMNFILSRAVDKVKTWKFDWERDYLLGSESSIFVNTFAQIERTLKELGQGHGTKFEFECYDVSHLYSLAYFLERGLVEPPFLVQCVFGVLGGMGADHDNFNHMITVADRLFGDQYRLSAFAAGRFQIDFAMHSLVRGGNVRVGLEDNLYIGRGKLASSNAEQVEKVARLLREMGREIATPDEAREMLKLKGRDQVAI